MKKGKSFSTFSVRSIPVITVTPEEPEPSTQVAPTASDRRISRPSPTSSLEDFDGVRVILKHPSTASQGSYDGGQQKELESVRDKNLKRHEAHSKFQLCRRQVYTAFWTNLLMRCRMKVVTFFELLLPVLVIWICIAALTTTYNWSAAQRMKTDLEASKSTPKQLHEDKLQDYFCSSGRLCQHQATYVVFTPNTAFTRELMRRTLEKLVPSNNENTTIRIGVDSAVEVADLCKANYRKTEGDTETPDPVGVIFTYDLPKLRNPQEIDSVPHTLAYEIRTFLYEISNTFDLFPYVEIPNEDEMSPYIATGFVGLQSAIDSAYIEIISDILSPNAAVLGLEKSEVAKIVDLKDLTSLEMFPFTIYLNLKIRNTTWAAIMFSIVFGYFCTTYFTLNRMILHRSAGILKMLKLHGMSSELHWLSLLFYELIFHFLTCIGITIVLFTHVTVQGGLLKYDDPFLVFFFLCLHGVAANCFCLFIASFFRKPTIGAMFGFMLSFLSYFIPMNLYFYGHIKSVALNVVLCHFLPNWCLANGFYYLLKFESYDSGVNFSNMNMRIDDTIILPILPCSFIFVGSSMFYFLITVWLDGVSSFKFKQLFCCCFQRKETAFTGVQAHLEELNFQNFDKPSVYEEDDLHLCTVQVRNVTVAYGSTIALDDVSMNFHEGQITVLLGYDGAGKNTLLTLIAGLVAPSVGTVLVKGVYPYSKSSKIDKKIGFCPKKLSLFPSLSVEEHIRLCCMLHGNSIANSKATTIALMKTFQLFEYRSMGVKFIPENQTRKLGLAMAMSNNPAVLLLEEPMFQMPASERNEIWTSLQYLKSNRTIIVTMGSVDDPDAYADRLVLMASGKIICSGSPTFLNKSYDVGTFLKVRKASEEIEGGPITFFMQLLHSAKLGGQPFSEVKLTGNEEQEHYVYFSVPRELKFSQVLHTLSSYKEEYGMSDIHVVQNTLGGIFYKLSRTGAMNLSGNSVGVFHQRRSSSDFISKLEIPFQYPKLPKSVETNPICLLRVSALVSKHCAYTRQKYWHYLCEFIVSFILIGIFVFFCTSYIIQQPGSTSRSLSATTYPDSPIPVYLKVAPEHETEVWRNGFKAVFGSKSGRLEFYDSSDKSLKTFSKRRIPTVAGRTTYTNQVVTSYLFDSYSVYNGYYSSTVRHSAPVALNVLKNVILRVLTPIDIRKRGTSFKVEASNHPYVLYSGARTGTVYDVTNALAGVLFAFLLGLIAASRIMLPLTERSSGFKFLQKMAGVRSVEYWLAYYICDIGIGVVVSILLTVAVFVCDTSGIFTGAESKLTICALSGLYLCWAALPFHYLFSRIVSNPGAAYGQCVMCHCATGSLPILVTYLIYGSNVSGFFYYIRFIFQIFPAYTITTAFVLFCEQVAQRNFCKRMPVEDLNTCRRYENSHQTHHPGGSNSAFGDPNNIFFQKCCTAYCEPTGNCLRIVGYFRHEEGDFDIFLVSMILIGQGAFYGLLLIILESSLLRTISEACKSAIYGDAEITKALQVEHIAKDVGVKMEREKIIASLYSDEPDSNSLTIADLTKVTGVHKVLDHVYFRMTAGTILGLLGPEDSGVTEIIKVITGQLRFTHGLIDINGISLANHREYLRQIGFCPSKPPLIPYLTGLQMVELMGRLRGIPSDYLTIHATKWLEILGFSHELQIQKCETYNYRLSKRLSFAMTFIGNPYILMFHEPTKSLDDNDQLLLWNLLTFLRKQGQSIIITSSSAEECAQICTKLVMLKHGKIIGIGVPQDIFSRYPKGWTLMIRLYHDITSKFSKGDIEGMTEMLKNYILQVFSPCELTEESEILMFFYLRDVSKTLSFMYGHMEEVKEGMPDFIDEYFIHEANLDDIIGNSPPPPTAEQTPSPPEPTPGEDKVI